MSSDGALDDWLRNLDGGAGELMQYSEGLNAEFESNLSLIATLKTGELGDSNSVIECVDPYFWEVVNASKFSHKLYFARGIATLPSAFGAEASDGSIEAGGYDGGW